MSEFDMFDIKKEPRLEFTDLIAALFIYLGFILFLICLHLLSINTRGYTSDVLSTTFTIFLSVFIGLFIFGIVGIITQLLRWLTWSIKTPKWKKKKVKKLGKW